MTSPDPITDRARILYAALALRVFTVKDLADYSGVNPETVRTQLRRDGEWFEEVELVRSMRRGGSYKRYRLKEGVGEAIKQASAPFFASVPDSRAAPETNSAVDRENDRERFETALNAAKQSLARIAETSIGEQRHRLIQFARFQLLDARDALQRHHTDACETRLTALLRKYEERSGQVLTDLETSEAPRSEPPPSTASLNNTRTALVDWTARIVGINPAGPFGSAPDESLERALRAQPAATSDSSAADAYLAPAARLLELVDPQSQSVRSILSREVPLRLAASAGEKDLRLFCSLAVIASLLDLDETVPLLFDVISSRNLDTSTHCAERQILLSALARLAGPNARNYPPIAAMYSQSLLAHSHNRIADIAILTPATLRAAMVDAPRVLQIFAERVYEQPTSWGAIIGRPEEQVIIKNLVIALQGLGFAPLLQQWDAFLERHHGVRFIAALTNPKYKAVELRRANDSDFALRIEVEFARYAPDGVSRVFMLPTVQDSSAGRRLANLIDSRPWSRSITNFSTPLAAKGRARLELERRRRNIQPAAAS